MGRLLEDGRLKGHPYELIPVGLNGVLTGLNKLKDGKASAVKYIYRIEDMRDVTMLGAAAQQETEGPTPGKPHSFSDFPFPSRG